MCVFLYYNRINAGINNPVVDRHMDALFGQERAISLCKGVEGRAPAMREALILEALAREIKELGGKYVLPFTFKNSSGARTSHKVVFVSKSFKGYEIMKDIMTK